MPWDRPTVSEGHRGREPGHEVLLKGSRDLRVGSDLLTAGRSSAGFGAQLGSRPNWPELYLAG